LMNFGEGTRFSEAKRVQRASPYRHLLSPRVGGLLTLIETVEHEAVDGLIVPAPAMRDISARLSAMTPYQRSNLPCIGQDRADLVVAGCAILEAILDLWPARRLGVADRGIREGILRSIMAAEHQSERTLRQLHRQRFGRSAR
ncbi:MAG: hypothetical protein RQ806_10550, partial [Erythrobacter sp.]|nr:hypothetical protein [Erythrobacter sp.]